MPGILGILGGIGAVGTILPAIPAGFNLVTGETSRKMREDILTRGPGADDKFNPSFIEKQFIDEDTLRPEYDRRQLKQLSNEQPIADRISALGVAPELGEGKQKYLSRTNEAWDDYQDDKTEEKIKKAQKIKFEDPGAVEARSIAEEQRNFNRYIQERNILTADRDRADRISRERIAREDRLSARQDNLNLGMAQLKFQEGQAEQNYQLALQKMNRDADLSHRQKMASIIGGIGALAGGLV